MILVNRWRESEEWGRTSPLDCREFRILMAISVVTYLSDSGRVAAYIVKIQAILWVATIRMWMAHISAEVQPGAGTNCNTICM
jgi:hypothetical protein